MQLHKVCFICKLIYIFRVVSPTIIRSTNNCFYSIWYWSTVAATCRYGGEVENKSNFAATCRYGGEVETESNFAATCRYGGEVETKSNFAATCCYRGEVETESQLLHNSDR